MSRERVDFRVEPEILEKLEEIASRAGIAGGRSAAIREAVYQYIERNESSWNTDHLDIRLPKQLTNRVNLFVANGDAETFRQAVVMAVERWCNVKESYHRFGGREEMEHIVAENMSANAGMDEARSLGKKITKR